MRTFTHFKWLSMLLAMFITGLGTTMAQTIAIDDFQIDAGASKQVKLRLVQGETPVLGFQCAVALPEGLIIQRVKAVDGILPNDEWGDPIQPSVSYTNGVILMYNDKGVTINSDASDLVTLYFKADDTFAGGDISLSNIIISAEGNVKIEPDDVTVKVTSNYAPPSTSYTITVSNAVNGSVTADKAEADQGETVQLTVTPAEGYELESLTVKTVAGVTVDVANNSFVMPAANVIVTATFKEKAVGPIVNPTITISDFYIEAGATKQVTIDLVQGSIPVLGFQCGVALPEGLTIQRVKAVDGILPNDEWGDPIQPSVSYTNGVILLYNDKGVTINSDASSLVTLYFKASDTFAGGDVTLSNIIISGEGNVKIEPEAVTAKVTSNYAPPSNYSITVQGMQNGSVTADKTEAAEGETVQLTVTPAEGYELESLTVKTAAGVTVDVSNNSFVMPAANVVVTATFKEKAVGPIVNPTITISDFQIDAGATKQVTINLVQGSVPVLGFQTTVVLPEGLTIQRVKAVDGILPNDEWGDPIAASVNYNNENGTILLYNDKGVTINSDASALVTLYFKASDTFAGGDLTLSNIIISGEGNLKIEPESVTAKVTSNYVAPTTSNVTVVNGNPNSGIAEGSQTDIPAGTQITVTATANEGYEFVAWMAGNNQVSTEASYTFTPTGNITLTATFKPIDYTIVYDLKGGEEGNAQLPNPTTYTIESLDITLINPVREGYTFAGWTGTDLQEPSMSVTIPSGSKGNRSYTATWTPVEYTITYNLAGGTLAEGVTNPANYTIESDAITLNNPTREGYTFAGWTGTGLTESTSSVTIAKGSTGNRSYTATWTPVEYTIAYNLDGGALAEGVTNPIKYTIESNAITLKNPTKTGYTFAGWTGTDLDGASTEVTIPTGSKGDRSYTATWTINKYKMTFVLGEGQNDIVIEQDFGTQLIAPSVMGRMGYSFAWDSEVPATIPAEDKVFTAVWTPIVYNITYNLNDGAMAEGEENPATYTIESEDITLKNPVREGYTFAGWTGTGLNEAITSVTIAQGSIGNRQYQATWDVNQYHVVFIVDNDTVYTADVNYGDPIVLPNDPVKEDLIFDGWDPQVPETMPAEDLTFIARFKSAAFLALFLDGDQFGNEIVAEEEVPMGEPIYEPDAPEHEGYTFTGWNPEVPEAMPESDMTFVAQFVINKYVIRYIVDGEVWKEEEVEYGAPVVLNDEYEWEGEIYETMPAHDIEYIYTTPELPVIDEEQTVDFSEEIDETTDLDGAVVGDLFVNISEENGGYDADDECLVITSSTSDETVETIDSGETPDPSVKKNFTGIMFKVPAGYGVVTVTAATIGGKVMKVKFGNDDALVYQTEGKETVEIEYNVNEDTQVYIYADDSSDAGVKGVQRAEEKADGEVRIYSIKVNPNPDGIQGLRDGVTSENASVYTLGGQKMANGSKLPRGIYVIDGKKVQVR